MSKSSNTPALQETTSEAKSWREALLVYTKKPVMVIALLGFSAGLPFLLVFSTLTAWLADVGVEKTAIGFFCLGWSHVFHQGVLGTDY